MSESIPRYTSTAEGFRTTEEIAALRPIAPAKPRTPRKAADKKPAAASGRLCPICREPFYEFDAFARHVWDETPAYVADLKAEVSTWREIRDFKQVGRMLVRVAPDSPEAIKLTGGVPLREVPDEECRKAARFVRWHASSEAEIPLQTLLLKDEYQRRIISGRLEVLPPGELAARARLREAEVRERAGAILPPPSERRARRIALGLTRAQFGEKLGVQQHAVYGWETGRTLPISPEAVQVYAQLLATADLTRTGRSAVAVRSAASRAAWPPEKVKSLRAETGLTQPEFAALLGFSAVAITTWECGRKTPSLQAISRLEAVSQGTTPVLPRLQNCAREECGTEFRPTRAKQMYCSRECCQAVYRQRRLKQQAVAG